MKVYDVTVSLSEGQTPLLEALGFGVALKGFARRYGGDARVLRFPEVLKIEMWGLSTSQFDECVRALGRFHAARDKNFCMTTVMRNSRTQLAAIVEGEYLREILTKKFLFALPSGAFLMSNGWILAKKTPIWVAHLLASSDRHKLWDQAVKARAAGRMVSVVWTLEDLNRISAFRE